MLHFWQCLEDTSKIYNYHFFTTIFCFAIYHLNAFVCLAWSTNHQNIAPPSLSFKHHWFPLTNYTYMFKYLFIQETEYCRPCQSEYPSLLMSILVWNFFFFPTVFHHVLVICVADCSQVNSAKRVLINN